MNNDRSRRFPPGNLTLSERNPGLTITRWLYEELRNAILDGRLARGAVVPPTRRLAVDYGVSRRIIVGVFEQLCDEGYLTAHVGAGTRVSDNVPEDYLPAASIAKPAQRPVAAIEPHYRRPVRPFRAIEPALSEFPIDIWARLESRCLRRVSTAILAGGDHAGYRPLREAIAAHLGTSRGVSCSADEIVVTSGTQQSLDLLARILIKPGDRVWVEDPGYTDAAEAFRNAGAKIVPVPVDESGMRPLRGARRVPKAIYLTPAHQFPLGVTLRLDRRLELLRTSRQNGTLLIEDDYDSEFRFAGRPVAAMKSLSGSGHVFLLGTFNKSLFPALRIGYIVTPNAWLDPLLRLRRLTERYPAGLPQVTLAAFLVEGHFAKHLRRMRELYGSRLTALRCDIARYLGGVLEVPSIEAGLTTPAFLRNGMSSTEASDRAQRQNLEAWALDRFAFNRTDLQGLVLGFAAFDERAIRRGVVSLTRALTSK